MLVYILKSSACLAIFFLFYKLFLEKENMHIFKRFYLLSTLILAFSIPLITFTSYVAINAIAETGDSVLVTNIPSQENLVAYLPIILWGIYGFGVLIFSTKFIYNLLVIMRKINRNPKLQTSNFTNVLLHDLVTPHTFFRYIFLNKNSFETQQIPKEVLLHEQTHALERHSFDILFIEIIQIVFWFNPLVYLIKHSIKLNHEFLADQAVLNHGAHKSTYQKILLQFSLNTEQPQLANAINYSFIRKRFTIMKTQTSKKRIWIRSLVLLPLLATLIYGFSNRTIVQKKPIMTDTILIQITKDKKIVLNGEKSVTIETLADEIKKIAKDYSPEQLATIKAIIEADGSVEKGFITDISIEAVKAGITHRILNPLKIEGENQEKATPEQITEYNDLAKHYNSQSKDKMVIKLKDIKRLSYIYELMTAEQKKNAEPFPNFPPPPPPASSPIVVKNADIPPPPPIPANATSEQKKKYKKTIENYKKQKNGYVYKHKTKDGEVVDVVVIPDDNLRPPPPPPAPLPKDAIYFINGKKATYKQAKELETDDIVKVDVIKKKGEKGEVHITTKQ